MDTNTQQAIYIAVNLFIFITLLTVALTLLTSTLKISTHAGEIISDSSPSYVSVIDEDLEEGYVYTYEDLLSIYAKNANKAEKLKQYKVFFAVDKVYSLSKFIVEAADKEYNPINNKDIFLVQKFSLEVSESEVNKVEYIFKAKP